MIREDVFKLVANELLITDATKRPFVSNHEALGVIVEEFEELKDEIKASHDEYRANKLMVNEAVQLSGVCIKLVENLYRPEER